MDSLLDTRSPSRFDSTSVSVEKQMSPIQGDQRAKQWETIDNTNRSRSDEEHKRPSSSTSSVQNNPGAREPRSDIETSPLRLERQQALEEPFKKFEISRRNDNRVNSAAERSAPENDKPSSIPNINESDFSTKPAEVELPPPSKDDENDVFWDADDSLPPPPPMDLLDPLETSQDSLPLPSPPREVLVEFPPSYSDYVSKRDYPVQKETFQQNGQDSDVIKPEQSAVVESSVEINEEPKIELNGPGKVDTSGVSDQALEFSLSTDLSSKETSLTENKTKSSPRAPPPAPLILTSTPTKLEEPSEKGISLDVSTSPYSVGSNTSTPSGSRPNSMLSPKLVELDKEKVRC